MYYFFLSFVIFFSSFFFSSLVRAVELGNMAKCRCQCCHYSWSRTKRADPGLSKNTVPPAVMGTVSIDRPGPDLLRADCALKEESDTTRLRCPVVDHVTKAVATKNPYLPPGMP
jgi:hypothetical protein